LTYPLYANKTPLINFEGNKTSSRLNKKLGINNPAPTYVAG